MSLPRLLVEVGSVQPNFMRSATSRFARTLAARRTPHKVLYVIPPMNACEQAETFRLLLAMGAATKPEIIAWADEIIARETEPPAWVIDISLAANDDDYSLEAKLRDLPCEGDRLLAAYTAVNQVLDTFAREQVSPPQVALMLHRWAFHAQVNEDDYTQANVPLWLADEIEYGYTTESDVVEALRRATHHFAAKRRAG